MDRNQQLSFLAAGRRRPPKPQKKAGWQRIRLMTEVPNTDLVAPRKVWVAAETRGE